MSNKRTFDAEGLAHFLGCGEPVSDDRDEFEAIDHLLEHMLVAYPNETHQRWALALLRASEYGKLTLL